MKISTNPSSTLTTSPCLVATVMTKMKTNALCKKDDIAVLQKHQVDMQGLQTVDRAFVGRVALEDRFHYNDCCMFLVQSFACLLRPFKITALIQWSLYTLCIQ